MRVKKVSFFLLIFLVLFLFSCQYIPMVEESMYCIPAEKAEELGLIEEEELIPIEGVVTEATAKMESSKIQKSSSGSDEALTSEETFSKLEISTINDSLIKESVERFQEFQEENIHDTIRNYIRTIAPHFLWLCGIIFSYFLGRYYIKSKYSKEKR